MPPRKSKFPPKSSKPAASSSNPSSAAEYIQEAADEESRSQKWRTGDPVKALRAAFRALDLYATGLQRFPSSFDLAYARAVLMVSLVQDDILAPSKQINAWEGYLGSPIASESATPMPEALERAAKACEDVVKLDAGVTDIRYNLGVVLCMWADEVEETIDVEGDAESAEEKGRRVLFLRDAAGRGLEECRALQLNEVEAAARPPLGFEAEDDDMAMDETGSSTTTASAPPQQTERIERYATVIAPTIIDDVIDTCLAEMENVVAILGFLARHAPQKGVQDTPPLLARFQALEASMETYLQQSTERTEELVAPLLALRLDVLNSRFRMDMINAEDYGTCISEKLEAVRAMKPQNPKLKCALGEGLIEFVDAFTGSFTKPITRHDGMGQVINHALSAAGLEFCQSMQLEDSAGDEPGDRAHSSYAFSDCRVRHARMTIAKAGVYWRKYLREQALHDDGNRRWEIRHGAKEIGLAQGCYADAMSMLDPSKLALRTKYRTEADEVRFEARVRKWLAECQMGPGDTEGLEMKVLDLSREERAEMQKIIREVKEDGLLGANSWEKVKVVL